MPTADADKVIAMAASGARSFTKVLDVFIAGTASTYCFWKK